MPNSVNASLRNISAIFVPHAQELYQLSPDSPVIPEIRYMDCPFE